MSSSVTDIPARSGNITVVPSLPDTERKGLTKKEISADHPTWCPGCGDFAVLALYFKLIEKRKLWHEKITTIAGIGCSSRFPYFVQAHGVHYIHGRALPFASGVSLSRPDLHVFVFGGDGDAFSIGGNHFNHTARKNIRMSYVDTHNVTDEIAAYKLADEPFPGKFGIFYKVNRPTKNKLEAEINAKAQQRVNGLKDWQILQQNFNRMK